MVGGTTRTCPHQAGVFLAVMSDNHLGRCRQPSWPVPTTILAGADNHLGRCRQPPWPVGLDGRRACPSEGQTPRGFVLSQGGDHLGLEAAFRLRIDRGIDGLMADQAGRIVGVHGP
jgi:hypothetical protein